jgi:glycosyltransferase involved in cell wall biosynthesis
MADVLFFSIEPWVQRFRSWFPGTPIHHLPVGSNIPLTHAAGTSIRAGYGIDPSAFVVGVFGSAHPSRLLSFVQTAVSAVADQKDIRVLYVGSAGSTIRKTLASTAPVIDAGPLPAEDVSRAFAAMDLYLAPFRKGVSTRRGSFMTGLQHGVATVSTSGIHTDPLLRDANGSAFLLAPDDSPDAYTRFVKYLTTNCSMREQVGATGCRFFDRHFSWTKIAGRLVQHLSAV